ncbi:MAG TPA: hypothetical protein VGB24_16010 [Longimicrobium sp.]|jgi:hypothetical protein|uniref:hypothetical protein n=1 Tax=Longimicrobium sp. TaxID=2029185 RepID=UPI002ED918EE
MQLRLLGIDPPDQIEPHPERHEPAVWIRRVRVLKELRPGVENIVRDVVLRRGLNIIWAPPESAAENALFQSGVAGHTAGKTTFCRLVRYALGERSFASETTRRRVRDKLPMGWLVAEVIVEGRPWAVARPFGVGAHPFCVDGGTVDQAVEGGHRSEYRMFLDAIASATTTMLPASRFPTRDEAVQWEHILPWLSRDQEARFADLLEWRHSSSSSDAPALNVDERQFLVRSVLGVITDAEREEQQRNVRLVAERKESAQWEPRLRYQATVDHERVQKLLGIKVAPPSSELFGSEARVELDRRRAEWAEKENGLRTSDVRESLRMHLEQKVASEAVARRDVEDAQSRLEIQNAAIEQLDSVSRGEARTNLLASLPPSTRDFCNVPLALARERGCPLVPERLIDLSERRVERTAAEDLQIQRQIATALEAEIQQKRTGLTVTEAATADARRAYLKATTAFEDQRARLLEEQAQLREGERLATNAEEASQKATELAEALVRLGTEVEESYKRQDLLRQEGREALGRFSATFDYVVRAIIGDEVTGRVDTSGRSLNLVVDHQGERESAALETVKLLAFDLAAMTDSIQGRGYFPRFLIHDGPREADMAVGVYERLFLYARRLEECFSGEASFQYILTTTTRPPEQFLHDPWLRLKLAGVPAEERLLGMNL